MLVANKAQPVKLLTNDMAV